VKRVPSSVLVLSIIGLIWAALVLVVFALRIVTILRDSGRPMPPWQDPIYRDTLYVTIKIVNLIVAPFFAALLLASCVGSMKLLQWARKAMLVYASAACVHIVVMGLFTYTYVIPNMSVGFYAGAPPRYYATSRELLMFTTVPITLLEIAFPVCVLYFFSRPKVIDAFNGIFPASPTNFPVEFPHQSA
jgi:hypothetical protein